MFFRKARNKVFCIGRNKTGTTSIASALSELGYRIGHQPAAELLMEDWAARDFRAIVRLCQTADAFQDVPFSLDYTFQIVDHAFPGSQFVLTVRNSAQDWYDSLVRFHASLFGKTTPPTVEDLMHCDYCRPGWLWRQQQLVYGADETNLYNPDLYMAHYNSHISRVQDYFKYRARDLLILDVSDANAMQYLCNFLGIAHEGQAMPHLNRSGND